MIYNNIGSIFVINEGVNLSGTWVVTEPVSVDDAKNFLRLTATVEDSLIAGLITSARQIIEKYLNLSLVPKTIQIECIHDGRSSLELPYGPVTMTDTDVFGIVSVSYRFGYKQDWKDVTSNTDNTYEFIGLNNCSLFGNIGQYRIKYTTDAFVANIINTALQQQITFMYQNRGDEQLYQIGGSRIPTAIVADIVKNTLAGISRVSWLG